MPVIEMGRQLASVYLTRFSPTENVPIRISVLDTQRVLGVETHWVENTALNLKGAYTCCGGACCEAYGPRIQTYYIPIYVYVNPQNSVDGELQAWGLTKAVYTELCSLISRYDLTQCDLDVTVRQQGYGRKTSMTLVPGETLRTRMSPEMLTKLQSEVEDFYINGERSLAKTVNEQDWIGMLTQAGWDFNNHTWLPGYEPVQSTRAGLVASKGTMPPSAPAGYGIPNRARPTLPNVSNVPPVQNVARPVAQPVMGSPTPVTSFPTRAPATLKPVMSSAPGVNVTPSAPPVSPVPPAPSPTSNGLGAQELTGSELDSLLDGI